MRHVRQQVRDRFARLDRDEQRVWCCLKRGRTRLGAHPLIVTFCFNAPSSCRSALTSGTASSQVWASSHNPDIGTGSSQGTGFDDGGCGPERLSRRAIPDRVRFSQVDQPL